MRKKHNHLKRKDSQLIIVKDNSCQKVIFIFSSTTYMTIQYIRLCQGLTMIIIMMMCRHLHAYSISISVRVYIWVYVYRIFIIITIIIIIMFNILIDSSLLFRLSPMFCYFFLVLTLYKHIDNKGLSTILRLSTMFVCI
jgi:hypothetical protein